MSAKGTTSSYFVIETNPEICTAIPRPGGLMKIDIPPKPSKLQGNALKAHKEISMSASKSSRSGFRSGKTPDPTSSDKEELKQSLLTVAAKAKEPLTLAENALPRDYKVKQAIAAAPWSVEFDEFSEAGQQPTLSDFFQDSVEILAMAIRIIMLLSRGHHTITDSQYKWLFSYLKCIRDEFGRTPPNVQGVLNHINGLTGRNIKSFLDEEEGQELTQ